MKKSKLIILTFLILNFQFSTFNCFAQFTKIFDFSDSLSGNAPNGNLISVGPYLYGLTAQGGTNPPNIVNGRGVIFKIKPDGTGYTKLLSCNDTTGTHPYGSLVSDGTYLYGMMSLKGKNGDGTAFKIKTDGTGFSKLLDFGTVSSDGRVPSGSFILIGSFLYGMTSSGGTSGKGILFKIKTDGTGYSKLLDFNGTSNGSSPTGTLIYDGTYFYGVTSDGGSADKGVIFRIKLDGTGYSKLMDFSGAGSGKRPVGQLISDGTYMYGTTGSGGGVNDMGIIFRIRTDGTGYTTLHTFQGTTDGRVPSQSLYLSGTTLSGMSTRGGFNDFGVIFKIKTDGTGFSKLLDFNGTPTGSKPFGSFLSDGTFLYAMTSEGGTSGNGVIFKYQIGTIGTKDVTIQNPLFDIYPNPTNGAFTVSLLNQASTGQYYVSILSIYGQIIEEKSFTGIISFETSTWAKGMYFVELEDENGIRVGTKKVVVE